MNKNVVLLLIALTKLEFDQWRNPGEVISNSYTGRESLRTISMSTRYAFE